MKPVSGALAHEMGFTNKNKLVLYFYLGNYLISVYRFCSNLSLVLYCIAYAAGGPFSVAQKRGEKTLWSGLPRRGCGRALKRRAVSRAAKGGLPCGSSSAVVPLRHKRQGHADSSPPLSVNFPHKS